VGGSSGERRSKGHLKYIKKHWLLLCMLIPGLVILIINNYIPMFGVVMAFKNFKISGNGFIDSLIKSPWAGFKNFEFFIKTPDAFTITRNTVLYNLVFIILDLVLAVPLAMVMSQIRQKKFAKFTQTVLFLPYFMSWVVVSYLVYSLLSVDTGFINNLILKPLGIASINWYSVQKYWPFIIPAAHVWKDLGYGTVIYLAAITGINGEYYEAAALDGAGKFRQAIYITVPELIPLMITLTLLAIGKIFNADFGLFFQVPQNSGILYPVTNVIDVYVYNALRVTGNPGMASAVGLYQATVGFILVVTTNWIIRRRSPENALF